MGVDHGGEDVPQNLEWGDCPQILSCCKILSTRLLALQCRKMCFLPLQQDFYRKSRHASPQNSSQIYTYAFKLFNMQMTVKFGSISASPTF